MRGQKSPSRLSFKLPVFVAENGLGTVDELDGVTADDDYRIDCVRRHLRQVLLAIHEDGVDCFGYTYWGRSSPRQGRYETR